MQGIPYGLWYNWGISDAFIADATATVRDFKKRNPQLFTVVFLHVGPNFQWQPYPAHEQVLFVSSSL